MMEEKVLFTITKDDIHDAIYAMSDVEIEPTDEEFEKIVEIIRNSDVLNEIVWENIDIAIWDVMKDKIEAVREDAIFRGEDV
jgi:hypothetical protein